MLSLIFTDPLIVLTIRWSLAALFGLAVIHKVMDGSEFTGALRSYRLVPNVIVVPAAYAFIAAEVTVVAGLVLNGALGAIGAVSLLCLYAAAMLIHLGRGRIDLDCGCGGPAGRRKISAYLVLRNMVLAAFAALTLWPSGYSRDLTLLDGFTALAASATMLLVGTAAARLSRTRFHGRSKSLARGD